MPMKQIFEEISNKIGGIIEESPVKDLEKNVKAAVTAAFSRLDLITREEYEAQQHMLEHLCEQVAYLQEEIQRLQDIKEDV